MNKKEVGMLLFKNSNKKLRYYLGDYIMKRKLANTGKNLVILALILIAIDYIVSMIYQNYATFDYQMSVIVFILLILMITIYILMTPDAYFKNEKSDVVDEDNLYFETGYEEHLQKVLESNQFKSVLINGPFGSGKTTMMEHVLKIMHVKNNEYIKFDLYGEEIDNNLEYTYEKFRQMEPWFILILKQSLNYTVASLFAFFSIALAAIMTKDINIKITVVILLIYTGLSIWITYSNTDGSKKRYIAKQLANIKFVIIDDLDRAYNDNTKTISFVHTLTKFLNDAENTKLILIGNKHSFKVQGPAHDEAVHILEKYYDFEFEVPIDIIKNEQIKIFEENLPQIHYNNEEMDDAISILEACSTREIIKLNKQINYVNDIDPVLIQTFYLSDYIFISILYIRNKVDVQNLLTRINNLSMVEFFYNDKVSVKRKFDEICKDFNLCQNEIAYLENSLNYTTGETETKSEGEVRYDNRIFNRPNYYKKNYSISNQLSPEQRIINFERTLLENPQNINRADFYYFYNSKLDENTIEKVTALMIEKCKDECVYSANLSSCIMYVISENDSRIGTNIKYNWAYIKYTLGEIEYTDIEKIINTANFDQLSIANQANLIENEYLHSTEKKYIQVANINDYAKYIDVYIEQEISYNVFDIFGEDIPGITNKQLENLLDLYYEKLYIIKCGYEMYAAEFIFLKISDEDNKILNEYNKLKSISAKNYNVDVSKYNFSFDD